MTPGDGYVELCWDGIENDACVSEYRVRTRVAAEYYRHQYDKPEVITKERCTKVENLRNNVDYEFSVIVSLDKVTDLARLCNFLPIRDTTDGQDWASPPI